MKSHAQIDEENAERLAQLSNMAQQMTIETARSHWADFQAHCARQNDRRANNFKTSYAPLTPDQWRDGDQFAAGVKLGHIKL